MADPRRSSRENRGTGWIWVTVGIVAVALVVWWVSAAVNGGEDDVTTEEMTAVEQTRQEQATTGDEQIFEGEGGLFEEEEGQAARSGQVLGDTPTGENQVQGTEPQQVREFTQWSQRQEQAEFDAQQTTEGFEQLDGAIAALIDRLSQPGEGEQAGGGPTRSESQQIQQHYEEFEKAYQQLEEAREDQQAQPFHEAANTAAQTLQLLQRQAQLDQLEEPVEQLQERVHEIQVDQPLSEQSEAMQAFFSQSAQVVEQMNQSMQISPNQPAQ